MKLRLNLELLSFLFILYSPFHTVLPFLLLVSSYKSNGTTQSLSSLQRTALPLRLVFFLPSCLLQARE